ncbi:MAG: oxaloacetate decarboxylase [Epulopiscium sp. Nele67-Bin001]|nr:MAG: oxaloacetate decarboxylase [Epulopiscium sp. Nele67-Bin001]
MEKIKINETVLRDGHQSLIATRLRRDEMVPILETMDQIGYNALEVWGGATFDACIRFLGEDPWERLRVIRSHVKNTKLQMLLRGQNLLGYRHYADDVVDRFVALSIENGIDIIRVFDALNDIKNLDAAIQAIKKYNGHCQCAMSYTTSPIHTLEYYVKLAKTMEGLGADSICIKDMAGVLSPYKAAALVTSLKQTISVPISLHTHCTGGIGEMIYMQAVEAGVDIIDTAISPFSGGTSQPPTESMAITLSEMERNPGLDMEKMLEVAEYFKPIRDKYMEDGTLNPKVLLTDPQTLKYQVPGGMLSNLLSQLKQQGASQKYEDVLREVPKVREDLGYPPLVTPLSQMVGTQALFNVLTGERYKLVPKEIKDYVKGLYGTAPAPINPEIAKKIIQDEQPIVGRPADLLGNELDMIREQAGDLAKNDEDVLAYALFPQVAPGYLEAKYNPKPAEPTEPAEPAVRRITVTM